MPACCTAGRSRSIRPSFRTVRRRRSSRLARVSPRRTMTLLVALNAALLVVGTLFEHAAANGSAAKLHIGLVFDVGGKNDRSFNESAWRGLQRAEAELGVAVDFI